MGGCGEAGIQTHESRWERSHAMTRVKILVNDRQAFLETYKVQRSDYFINNKSLKLVHRNFRHFGVTAEKFSRCLLLCTCPFLGFKTLQSSPWGCYSCEEANVR